jgi:potassium/hydrogen antiporter
MTAHEIMRVLAIVLCAGVASELGAQLLHIPRMIILIAVGALVGPHVLDIVELPLRSSGIQVLLTLGVSMILFYGGLGLSVGVLKKVAIGLGLLVIPGVLLTGVITGLAAAVAFDLPFKDALVIGAVLASTDPAILIPLLEKMRIREKVLQTIVAESAFNDVTGAVFSLSVAAAVIDGGGSFSAPLVEFVKNLTISSALGIVFGLALALLVSTHKAGILRETPVAAVLIVGSVGYFTIDSAGGSGYLGAFLSGLIVANLDQLGLKMHEGRRHELEFISTLVAEVMVTGVFVTLGANIPFDKFGSYALPALATLAVFIFIARPLTVLACLLPDRRGEWTRNEIVFLAWTRETGVIPAAVAALLISKGLPNGDQLVTTVGLAILATLLLQSTTKPWLARKLGLGEASTETLHPPDSQAPPAPMAVSP